MSFNTVCAAKQNVTQHSYITKFFCQSCGDLVAGCQLLPLFPWKGKARIEVRRGSMQSSNTINWIAQGEALFTTKYCCLENIIYPWGVNEWDGILYGRWYIIWYPRKYHLPLGCSKACRERKREKTASKRICTCWHACWMCSSISSPPVQLGNPHWIAILALIQVNWIKLLWIQGEFINHSYWSRLWIHKSFILFS